MSALFGFVLEFLAWCVFEIILGAIGDGLKVLYRYFFPGTPKPLARKRKIKFRLAPYK